MTQVPVPTNNTVEIAIDKGLLTFAIVMIAIVGSILVAGIAVAYHEHRGSQFERELK